MTFIDIFGFKRCTGYGPLTVSKPLGQDDQNDERRDFIEEQVQQTLDVLGYDGYNLNQAQKANMYEGVSLLLYTGENTLPSNNLGPIPAQSFHENCMSSSWANSWYSGMTNQTVEATSDAEEIASKASICASLAESDTGVAPKFQLVYLQDCNNCTLASILREKFSESD